jgi:hypothetical protein
MASRHKGVETSRTVLERFLSRSDNLAHWWIAALVADLSLGFTVLSRMVQTAIQENPFVDHGFVFRGDDAADQTVVMRRRCFLVFLRIHLSEAHFSSRKRQVHHWFFTPQFPCCWMSGVRCAVMTADGLRGKISELLLSVFIML